MSHEPYRVLVVDDEPIVHSIIERILDGCSIMLTLAGTALSGLPGLSRRLRYYYPDSRLEIEPTPTGTTVLIRLPIGDSLCLA